MLSILPLLILLIDGDLCANNTLGKQNDIVLTSGQTCLNTYIASENISIPLPLQIYDPGSPCTDSPFRLKSDSPAIGAGTEIEGFTCPAPGHPSDGNCLEWFNQPGPDIGACQAVYLSENISVSIISE